MLAKRSPRLDPIARAARCLDSSDGDRPVGKTVGGSSAGFDDVAAELS